MAKIFAEGELKKPAFNKQVFCYVSIKWISSKKNFLQSFAINQILLPLPSQKTGYIIMPLIFRKFLKITKAEIAQLVEQLICNQ